MSYTLVLIHKIATYLIVKIISLSLDAISNKLLTKYPAATHMISSSLINKVSHDDIP